jgi:hypothetical protein
MRKGDEGRRKKGTKGRGKRGHKERKEVRMERENDEEGK